MGTSLYSEARRDGGLSKPPLSRKIISPTFNLLYHQNFHMETGAAMAVNIGGWSQPFRHWPRAYEGLYKFYRPRDIYSDAGYMCGFAYL